MSQDNLDILKESLLKNVGYRKWGSNKLAAKFGVTKADVKKIKAEVRVAYKDEELTPLQVLLADEQIPEADVNHFWYKGKHYSVHAKKQSLDPKEQFQHLIEEAKRNIVPIKFRHEDAPQEMCAVVNIYDMHLDKRDVDNPDGGEIAVRSLIKDLERAFGDLMASLSVKKPTLFIFPVGNDLFTGNGFSKATKKGTPQDPMVTQEMVFKEGLQMIRSMINTMSMYGKVIVPMIYGNHSADSEWYLGVCLETLFEGNENVEIDNRNKARKYIQFAENLFGFGHGDLEKRNIDKLPLIMATQEKHLWAATKYRKFYLGDQHHLQEFKFLRTKDNAGCTVQFLRSTSITDAWHEDNMFIGVPRTMEAEVWSATKGQVANYSENL